MHGKRFVSVGPSSPPYPFLVIALSVDARLAPAACIIKLPACRNADEAYSHEAQSPHTRSTARHSLVTSLETVHPRAFRPPSAILLLCPLPFSFTRILVRHILELSRGLSHVRMLRMGVFVARGCNKSMYMCTCAHVPVHKTHGHAHSRCHPFAFLHPRAPQPNSP